MRDGWSSDEEEDELVDSPPLILHLSSDIILVWSCLFKKINKINERWKREDGEMIIWYNYEMIYLGLVEKNEVFSYIKS